MPPSEKMLEGARLFDLVRDRMLDGIRAQYPEWDDEQVRLELRRRLDVQRRLQEKGIYRDAGRIDESIE